MPVTPEPRWHGHLQLNYRREGARTTAHDRHSGPLRVLQRLYPEGETVCHHVLVHPPGGIVGGDTLALQAQLAPGSHGLITTPGATRFYRSAGAQAHQTVNATLDDGARLEWLPLETIAYRGCRATNHLQFRLAPTAQMMGWDLLALGLPAAQEPFDCPRHPDAWYTQAIELPGVWLERGTVRADDALLLNSPLGWHGRRVMGTMWFAQGQALAEPLRQALVDRAREVPAGPALQVGVSSPHEPVVVVRALAPRVEPLMAHFVSVWKVWRELAWQLAPCPPRVWRT